MLSRMRKTYDAAFKAKGAFKAVKEEKTIAHIASEFSVHPNQIRFKGRKFKELFRYNEKFFEGQVSFLLRRL